MSETGAPNNWRDVGRIEVVNDRLALPTLPARPGLYRLTFASGAVYFGEANDIERRVGDYLVYYPATGIESEFRLHKRLVAEGGAAVHVLLGDEFGSRSQRCVREHHEIKQAKLENKQVLNGGTLEERIAFHESEIVRLKKQLELQKGQSNAIDN